MRTDDRRKTGAVVLLITSVAAFMGYLDVTIVNVSFPSIQADFFAESPSTVIWVLDIYSIVLAGLLLVSGRTSDVVGHRRMFLVGVTLFTLGSAGCIAAPSLMALIIGRAVQAFGAAIFTPASLALILTLHEPRVRPIAVATWTSAAALAAAVGPSLGGVLTGEGGSWRWIFVLNVPVGVAVIAAGLVLIPKIKPGGRWPSVMASIFLLGGAFMAALAITRGGIWGWESTKTIAVGVASVVGIVLFFVQNARSSRRLLDEKFLARGVVASNAVTFIVSLTFFAYLLTGVLFMTAVWQYSILKSGLAMSAGPISAIPAALIAGKLSRQYAHLAVAVGTALIAAFGITAATLLRSHPSLGVWVALGAMVGAGIGASLPLLNALAVEGVGDTRFAAASALNSTVRQFAGVLAFAGVAATVGEGSAVLAATTYQPVWWAIGAAGVAGTVMSIALTRSNSELVGEVAVEVG